MVSLENGFRRQIKRSAFFFSKGINRCLMSELPDIHKFSILLYVFLLVSIVLICVSIAAWIGTGIHHIRRGVFRPEAVTIVEVIFILMI